MARLFGEVPLAAFAASASTTYILWQGVAPANQRIVVSGWGVFMAYNTNGTPGLLTFNYGSAAKTGGTSITPVHTKQGQPETFQSTWSTQPTTGAQTLTPFRNEYINPQVSIPEYIPDGSVIEIQGGGILVVTFTPQVSASYAGFMRIEE